MKVALSVDPAVEKSGGSASFAQVLEKYLPRHGMEVVVGPARACDAFILFAQHVELPGFPWLDRPGAGRLARQLGLWALRWQRRRGVKILHRLDERRGPHDTPYRLKKHRLVARFNRLAHVTIFQSRFVRENMGPICFAPRAAVIHNGVDREIFRPDGPRRPPLAGSPRVLHEFFTIGSSKRLDRLGELLAALGPEARVYLVGRHTHAQVLKDARDGPVIRKILQDPRVEFLGWQTREKVAEIMRACDFLFFPSELEPCSNIVLEAMASGLPLLYHPSGGTPELVGGAGVPLSGALASDVAAVLGKGADLRERSLERAEEFSAEKVVARYAALIRDVVEERGTGARERPLIAGRGKV